MDNKSEWWYSDFEEVLPSSEISDDDDRPVSSLHTRAKIRKMIEDIVAEAERRTWEEATDRMFQELEAVKGLNSFVPETHHKEYLQGIFQAYRILKSKLSSLTKK